MRLRASDLGRTGWTPPETLLMPDWCGCSTEYLPVPDGGGKWQLVPIWEPGQTATHCDAGSQGTRTERARRGCLPPPPTSDAGL
jgi:hypothetical protein